MEINVTIVFQFLVLLVLLTWLSRFLFGPLQRLFDEREKRIAGNQNVASTASALADQKWQQIHEQIRHMQDASSAELYNGRAQVQEACRAMVKTARDELERQRLATEAELQKQSAVAREELLSQIPEFSKSVYEKLVPQGFGGDSFRATTDKMEFSRV